MEGILIAWSDIRGARYRVNTTTSRDALRDGHLWFEAFCRVVQTNLNTLRELDRSPSPAQRETLMRVFEDQYRRTLRRGDRTVANQALEYAQRWLKQCRVRTPAVALRKLLGISLTARLAQMRRSD